MRPKYTVETDYTKSHLTCLQGHLNAEYYVLNKLFGNPLPGDGYKIQAEWVIEFEDPENEGKTLVGTIYDWKMGDEYLGEGEGTLPKYIESWNIGGHSPRVVDLITKLVDDYTYDMNCKYADTCVPEPRYRSSHYDAY